MTASPLSEAVARARGACREAHDAERYAAARTACRKALQLNDKLPDVMVMLADVALAEGKNAEALRWARGAIEIDPGLPEAYVVVGTVEQLGANHEKAKAAFERYLKLAPHGKYAADVRSILGSGAAGH